MFCIIFIGFVSVLTFAQGRPAADDAVRDARPAPASDAARGHPGPGGVPTTHGAAWRWGKTEGFDT